MLYAENELFGAELNAVRSQADAYTQVVNVYKAGGGWVNEAEQLAPKPQGVAAREAPAASHNGGRRPTRFAAGPPQHRVAQRRHAPVPPFLRRPQSIARLPPGPGRDILCQRNT